MYRLKTCLITSLALLVSACGLSGEQAQIAETLEETISALETGDLDKLWQVSAPEARDTLTNLHTKIRRGMEVIDVVYPKHDRAAARQSIGGDFIGAIPLDGNNRGAKLLAAFIQPDALRLDQAARDGLRNKGAQIEGDRATIKTTAGETFTFQRTSEGWRSALVMDILQRSASFRKIEENVDAVIELADGKRKLWVTSDDPTTPNGAFNVIREALESPETNEAKLFTLLAESSRAVFAHALNVSRKIQKTVRRGVVRAKRKGLYARHGIAHLTTMRTDVELFTHWSKSKDFKELVLPAGVPAKIDGDINAGRVTLVTDQEKEVLMVREQDGFWHWSGNETMLREAILKPLESKLSELKGSD